MHLCIILSFSWRPSRAAKQSILESLLTPTSAPESVASRLSHRPVAGAGALPAPPQASGVLKAAKIDAFRAGAGEVAADQAGPAWTSSIPRLPRVRPTERPSASSTPPSGFAARPWTLRLFGAVRALTQLFRIWEKSLRKPLSAWVTGGAAPWRTQPIIWP